MGIIVFIGIIFILLICLIVKSFRLKIAILAGLGISVLSFFALIILALSVQRTILWILLGIFYASTIVFFILWNMKLSRKIYLLLGIPVICIIAGIGTIAYQYSIDNLPIVDEKDFYLYEYAPFGSFRRQNLLAELDTQSSLKIIDNLPILDGATALYPVYASFVQAVYPESEYRLERGPVFCNRTDGAYDNLLKGEVDIIFCAAPSDFQISQFHENEINLKLVPIGKEAFVFFVNKNNPVNNLAIEEIQGIYSGKIRNWKQLNGNYRSIRAFQRPKNSGSQTMLEKVMGAIPIANPRKENVSDGMFSIISQVAVYRNFSNAIGYSFLYYSTEMVRNDQIKLLAVNGIYPSKETIQDGGYPFSDNFYAIYVDDNNKNENIELFIEWILSSQGQELIYKTGYIPINSAY